LADVHIGKVDVQLMGQLDVLDEPPAVGEGQTLTTQMLWTSRYRHFRNLKKTVDKSSWQTGSRGAVIKIVPSFPYFIAVKKN